MSRQLFTSDGKRKYLTLEEMDRFLAAANQQERAEVRSFALVLAYTGCRISEALALTPASIDIAAKTITFRTLKQRDRIIHRAVPVPDGVIDTLELVHGIRKAQRGRKGQGAIPLWNRWQRTQAWKHIKSVMDQADIVGEHASPKGLRHGFGVRAIQKTRNPRLVQKWLGHRSLETTTIYMDVIGQEEREAAQSMWV